MTRFAVLVWIDIMIKQVVEFMEGNILEKRFYRRVVIGPKTIKLLRLKKIRVISLLKII